MRFSSMAMPGRLATSDPVAMAMALVSTVCFSPLMNGDLDLARAGDAAGAVQWIDLVLLQQKRDAVDIALHALVLEGEHGGKVERRASP